MKIVIDTNLLIDGSADDYNYGNRIVDDVIQGKIEAYANRQTIAENKLLARRKITDGKYLDKLNQFFDTLNLVETKTRLDIVEDFEDNKILSSAVDSNASYLVTSDHHLLKLEEYNGIKITTPAGFWSRYEQDSGASWRNWINDFIK